MCSVHRGRRFRPDVFCSQGVTVQTRYVLFTGGDGSDQTFQTRCVLFTGCDGSDQTVQTRCVLFTGGDGSDQMCSVHTAATIRTFHQV